jgi:hypothetical protein
MSVAADWPATSRVPTRVPVAHATVVSANVPLEKIQAHKIFLAHVALVDLAWLICFPRFILIS